MAMPLTQVNDPSLHHPPTYEEMQLIQDAIILPLALVVVERNRRELDRKARALRSIFARAADILLVKIKSDLTANTKRLVHEGITINKIYSSNGGICSHYNCRGREDRISFTHDYIRNEINLRISAYNAETFAQKISK